MLKTKRNSQDPVFRGPVQQLLSGAPQRHRPRQYRVVPSFATAMKKDLPSFYRRFSWTARGRWTRTWPTAAVCARPTAPTARWCSSAARRLACPVWNTTHPTRSFSFRYRKLPPPFRVRNCVCCGENVADAGATCGCRLETKWGHVIAPFRVLGQFAYSLCGSETPAQLSSLIASDEHSPAYYQIVGSLSNSDEFARHFGCAEDSAMNPPHKCVLW